MSHIIPDAMMTHDAMPSVMNGNDDTNDEDDDVILDDWYAVVIAIGIVSSVVTDANTKSRAAFKRIVDDW